VPIVALIKRLVVQAVFAQTKNEKKCKAEK